MSRTSHTYDHEITIGSTTKGFYLIRGDDGRALYNVSEEVPRYDAQIKFMMKDWSGGHGQFAFDEGDVYFEGQSIDTTQEGKVFPGPEINQVGISGGDLGANPVCSVWYSAISKYMVATATKVFWYDGTDFVEKVEIAGETITDLIEFDGILYVALGSSTKYYYSSDGASYTQTDLTDGYAEEFLNAPNAAGTSNVLWKFKQPNEISSTTDGRTVAAGGSQWSSAAYIGDTSNNITAMFIANNNLLVGREDNLFHYDSDGGVHPLMSELKHNRTTNNFKYVTDWQAAVYFSFSKGIGEISSYDSFDIMGPLENIGEIGKVGVCVGLTSDKDFVYAAMDEGTNTIIYKGREVRRPTGLRWEWCPWIFVGTSACATIRIVQHSATDRRLWFGSGNYCNYVTVTDNPLADSNARFAASSWIRFSYTYGTSAYWDKLYQSIITETSGCDSGKTVTPKYRKNEDSSATALTSAITTNGVVKTVLTTSLSCKRIQFELHFATDSNTSCPVVSYFEAIGTEKPEVVRIHEAVYSIGDTPSRKAETMRAFLRGGRTATALIKFADLRYGETSSGTAGTDYYWCVMMPGSPEEVEITHEKGRAPELGLRVKLQEINLSTAAGQGGTDALFGGTSGTYVLQSMFNANTILAANTDDTPAALTIAEQTLVGRITGGNIVGLTATQARTLLDISEGADVTTSDLLAMVIGLGG